MEIPTSRGASLDDVGMELELGEAFSEECPVNAERTPAKHTGTKSRKRRKTSSVNLPADSSNESLEEKVTKRLRSHSDSRSETGRGGESVAIGTKMSDLPNLSVACASSSGLLKTVDTDGEKQAQSISKKYRELISDRYKPNCVGPYCVYLERYQPGKSGGSRDVDEAREKTNADVVDIGESLYKFAPFHMGSCYNLHHMGRDRMSVSFGTYHDANSFLDVVWQNKYKVMEEEVWIAYIPPFKIFRQVILRGIDNPKVDPAFVKEHLCDYLVRWPVAFSRQGQASA